MQRVQIARPNHKKPPQFPEAAPVTKTGEKLANALCTPDHKGPVERVQLLVAAPWRFSTMSETAATKRTELLDTEHTKSAGREGPVGVAPDERPMIRVRDLRGFIKVEDAALLWGDERLEQSAAAFTTKVFGITGDDLDDLRPDDGVSIDPMDLSAEMQRHPRRLLVDYLADDEAVEYLLGLGFDLRDERGQPSRATRAFAAVVEAVARGLAGHQPDRAEAEAESFGERMDADAKAFMRARRR